ncbi:MAG: outer membrane beta-barrel protein [Polaromonas sp.]
MKLNAKKSLVFAGLVLAAGTLTPHAAFAQDMGFYIGAGVGQSKGKDACSDLGGVGFSGSCDDTDTGGKLFLGYQFNKNFAVEGGYVDLGKFKASGTISGVPVSADAKAKTWQLVAVGTLPLANNFSVFGKAGVHRWDLDVRASALGSTITASDNGTDLTLGIGAGYEFTKNLGVRLEWERFRNVGEDATTGKSNVDLISVGLRYRF